jgi:hypothetical protein
MRILINLFIVSCQTKKNKKDLFKQKTLITEDSIKVLKQEEYLKVKDSVKKNPIQTTNNLRLELFKNIPSKNLPTTSKKVDTLYFYDEGQYIIKRAIKGQKIDSTLFDLKKERKGVDDASNESFYHFYFDYERQFYPIYKIEKSDFIIIGCFTFFYESDFPGVQFEFHSFNKEGEQLDYLIAYCRFTFEVNYENNFSIDKDLNIRINKRMTEFFDGDLDNELETPRVTKRLENYILNEDGLFEKVEK